MGVYHAQTSGEPNPGDGRIGGEDWDTEHVGSSDWDFTATVSSEQTVTNSVAPVSVTDLEMSVTTGSVWRIEYDIVYSADTTCDLACSLNVTSGTMFGFTRHIGSDTTANAILVSTGVRQNSVATTSTIAAGGGTLSVRRSLLIEAMFEFSSNATLRFRFAQNVLTAGQSSIIRAGSRMRARLMSSDQTIDANLIDQTATASAPTVS